MKKKLCFALGIMLLAAMACKVDLFGTPAATVDPYLVLTAAAQTLAAVGQGGHSVPTSTFTVPAPVVVPSTPTLTPTITATVPTGVCNQATFVDDITIDDGTTFTFGQTFTKTWRLKNSGTCTWTSGYALIFDHGDAMSGPASQQLTTGTVPPGSTLDISVNLTAPSTAGSYRGYWRLREPGGTSFGLPSGNSFYVDIKAESPAAGVTLVFELPFIPLIPMQLPITKDLAFDAAHSGAVASDGHTYGFPNVGDMGSNKSMQAFVSFNISSIPAGSTVSEVSATFNDYDILGNPFGGLGSLRLYGQSYGNVTADDYTGGSPIGAFIRWDNAGELNSTMAGNSGMISYVQSKAGSSLVQFRLQFNTTATDNDGADDTVRFGNGIKITVKYTAP
jgi:hypothetical protein